MAHTAVLALLSFLMLAAGAAAQTTRPATGPAPIAVLAEVQFDLVPLEEALDRLAGQARMNIVVAWTELEAAGVHKSTPIKLRLWDVQPTTALSVLLRVASGDVRLNWRRDEQTGVLLISTTEALENDGAVPRVYDVRDLIERDAAYLLSHRPPRTAAMPPNYFGSQVVERDGFAEAEQGLIEIVEQVESDTWRDNGGKIGQAHGLAGWLVISTTPAIHRKIEALLNLIREVQTESTATTRPATSRPTSKSF